MSDSDETLRTYTPITPTSPFITDIPALDHQITQIDNLFYRQDAADFAELVAAVLDDPSQASLLDYQRWAETGWKTEHGTYDSVIRFHSIDFLGVLC